MPDSKKSKEESGDLPNSFLIYFAAAVLIGLSLAVYYSGIESNLITGAVVAFGILSFIAASEIVGRRA